MKVKSINNNFPHEILFSSSIGFIRNFIERGELLMGKVSGNTHTQQQLNNYANQRNSNNSAYRANNNNHANQLNPNNQASKSSQSK